MSLYSMAQEARKLRKLIATARSHVYLCLKQDEVTDELKEQYMNNNELLVIIGGWDADS